MLEEKILTKHPQGKSGRKISKAIYNLFKESILHEIRAGELTHSELFVRLNKKLKGKFDGNISWYAETVKLDLEARNLIKRDSSKPQKYAVN